MTFHVRREDLNKSFKLFLVVCVLLSLVEAVTGSGRVLTVLVAAYHLFNDLKDLIKSA